MVDQLSLFPTIKKPTNEQIDSAGTWFYEQYKIGNFNINISIKKLPTVEILQQEKFMQNYFSIDIIEQTSERLKLRINPIIVEKICRNCVQAIKDKASITTGCKIKERKKIAGSTCDEFELKN